MRLTWVVVLLFLVIDKTINFAHAGRVSENSLFSDAARQKRQTPPTGNFTPIFFSQLNITDEHRSVCGKNKQCLFDIATSGDATLAMTTLEYETEFNKTVDILSKL